MENARYYLDLARRVSRATDTRPSIKRYVRVPFLGYDFYRLNQYAPVGPRTLAASI